MSALILDTCGLIWLTGGGGELSAATLKAIQEANIVYVSAASAFEIGGKVAQKKLELLMAPVEWYHLALDAHDLVEIPITGEISLAAAALPAIHKNPADRLIIATAILKSLRVVTHDARFAEYGVLVSG